MLIFAIVLLVLIPSVVILYPFVRRRRDDELVEDETSTQAELSRRWDSALAGLRTTELERAIGNLSEEDHAWLSQQYITEAAQVMRAMELEEQQQQELLEKIKLETERVRDRALGKQTDNQRSEKTQDSLEDVT